VLTINSTARNYPELPKFLGTWDWRDE